MKGKVISKFISSFSAQDNRATIKDAKITPNSDSDWYEIQVPNDQIRTFGGSGIIEGVDDRRIFSATLKDSGSQNPQEVDVRFTKADSNKQNYKFLDEKNHAEFDTTNAGVSQGVPLGEGTRAKPGRQKVIAATENEYLILQARLQAASGSFTVDTSATTLTLPVTIMTLESGL